MTTLLVSQVGRSWSMHPSFEAALVELRRHLVRELAKQLDVRPQQAGRILNRALDALMDMEDD